MLDGLFYRFVVPLFKMHSKMMALDALRTSMNLAENVLGGGRGLKESVKKRVPKGIKRTVQSLVGQSGSVVRRRKRTRRKIRASTKDIFA